MHDKKENKNSGSDAIYPAVLKVSGEAVQRWCAAIWSTSPEETQLVDKLHGLVEGTLLSHWMQPPAQYKPLGPAVNSFDVVFYDAVPDEIAETLAEEGWKEIGIKLKSSAEYEQFETFQREAGKVGRSIPDRPVELWRLQVSAAAKETSPNLPAIGRIVARQMKDDVWGDSPGWYSKVFCEEVRRRTEVGIMPNMKGLTLLEETLFDDSTPGIRWLDPIAFQAISDLIGVVIQSKRELEVQWGTCPVDPATGLAPAPLFRMRRPGHGWHTVPVGRDVLRRCCLPWEKGAVGSGCLVSLVEEYETEFLH